MSKIVARNAALGIHDSTTACRSFTGSANSVTITYSAEAPETTAFGDDLRQRLQDGIKDWELTFDAFFGTGASEVDETLYGILGASTHVSFGPSGSATGAIWYSACAVLTNYEMTFGIADAATVSGTLVARSGSLTRSTWPA